MAQPKQELLTKPDAINYRYQAFLSYAHEDKPTVAWLHNLLTSFWVPGKRRRLIFMDQESLPADGGLSSGLKDALSESRYLIVCCSKSSAESYWVNGEINEFLKSHTSDNVLACMVGPRGGELFEVPLAVQNIEKQINDELLKPDLRGHPEKLKGTELKTSIKEALSLLAPLVDLPGKDSLLDRRKKSMIIGSLSTLLIVLIAIGWKLWDNRPQSQINKILDQSPGMIKAAAFKEFVDVSNDISDLLSTLVLTGRINEALEAARKIENPGPCAEAMACIAEALAKAGKTDELKQAATEAIEAARKVRDTGSRSRALVKVVTALANNGKSNEAFEAARKVEDADFRSQALINVVEALAKAGKTDELKQVATEVLETARKVKGEVFQPRALVLAVDALAKAGKTDEMKQAATEAIEAASKIRDAGSRSETLLRAVEALAEAGKTDEALEAARKVEGAGFRSQALISVVKALANNGKSNEALEAARKVEGADYQFVALVNVVEALGKAGKTDELKQVTNEALEAAHKIENAYDRSFALVNVIEMLADADKTEEMKQAFTEAIEAASKIMNEVSRSEMLFRAVVALAIAGKTDEATEAARKIEDPRDRSQALVRIVKVLANGRDTVDKARNVIEAARQAAELITEEGVKSKAFAYVATGLAKLHLYRQARELVDLNNTSATDKLTAYTTILREYHIERNPDQAKLFEKEQKED